jgi:hypothetical protein
LVGSAQRKRSKGQCQDQRRKADKTNHARTP